MIIYRAEARTFDVTRADATLSPPNAAVDPFAGSGLFVDGLKYDAEVSTVLFRYILYILN